MCSLEIQELRKPQDPKIMSPSEVTQLSPAQKISMFNKVCRTTNLIMYYGHCLFSFWCKCLFAKLVCSSFCLRLSQIVQVFLDGSCILFHLIFLLIIGSRNICFSLQMPSEFLSDTDFLILKAEKQQNQEIHFQGGKESGSRTQEHCFLWKAFVMLRCLVSFL